MRRLTAILLLVLTSLLLCPAVYASEVSFNENNGDRLNIFGSLTINEKNNGDVVVVMGDAVINKDVNGDVIVVLGNATVNAKVSGEVIAVLGTVKLRDNAVVNGDVVSVGELERSPTAEVSGQEVNINMGLILLARTALTVVSSLLVLVLGLILITVFKERFYNISLAADERIGRKFAIGFLGFLGLSILMLILAITVIIPLVYIILLLLAEILVCVLLGKVTLKFVNSDPNIYIEFVTGVILTTAVKVLLIIMLQGYNFIFYALAYTVLSLLASALGFGILIDTKFGSSIFNGKMSKNREWDFKDPLRRKD